MIIIFSFQTYSAIRLKKLDLQHWTTINYYGQEDYEYLTNRGKYKTRVGSISGVFSNEATLGGIKLSFILSALAAALACVIVGNGTKRAAWCLNMPCCSPGCCRRF